VPIDRASANG
jgi:hypothetical protein